MKQHGHADTAAHYQVAKAASRNILQLHRRKWQTRTVIVLSGIGAIGSFGWMFAATNSSESPDTNVQLSSLLAFAVMTMASVCWNTYRAPKIDAEIEQDLRDLGLLLGGELWWRHGKPKPVVDVNSLTVRSGNWIVDARRMEKQQLEPAEPELIV